MPFSVSYQTLPGLQPPLTSNSERTSHASSQNYQTRSSTRYARYWASLLLHPCWPSRTHTERTRSTPTHVKRSLDVFSYQNSQMDRTNRSVTCHGLSQTQSAHMIQPIVGVSPLFGPCSSSFCTLWETNSKYGQITAPQMNIKCCRCYRQTRPLAPSTVENGL